jgi:hypothetical protein
MYVAVAIKYSQLILNCIKNIIFHMYIEASCCHFLLNPVHLIIITTEGSHHVIINIRISSQC